MYIGKLNDRYAPIAWRAAQSSSGKPIRYKEAGDPFRGERLTVDWSELVPFGLELTFRIPEGVWLNATVLEQIAFPVSPR